jgi:hypothetical protein
VNYLNQSEYPYAFRYLMLKSVLKDNYDFKTDSLIKRTRKTVRNFTPFDAGTLSELYGQKSDYLLKDYTINQLNNAEAIANAREVAKTSEGGQWIKFSGGESISNEERVKNAADLSSLVQDTYWCTKTNAKNQLDGGDFYVYATESGGKKYPRIAIRMEDDKVGEVRGNASSAQDLEPEMNPIAEDFLVNNLDGDSGKKWLESIKYNQRAYKFYLTALNQGIYEGFVKDFIDLKKDEKKYLLDFEHRNGHIERIERYVKEKKDELDAIYGKGAVIFDLSEFNLELTKVIFGDASFHGSQIESLGSLQTIVGGAYFGNSKIKYLGSLQTIGGYASFWDSKIKSLGNLQTIGGNAIFRNSQVESLGNLQAIGGDADFYEGKLKSLGNLQTIGGRMELSGSQVESLGNLKTIGDEADFRESQIESLGNLQAIGGRADFRRSIVKDLGNLQTIGSDADFSDSQIKDLGNLQAIGRSAYFDDSQVKDLGNLQKIGHNAFFGDRTD